MSDTYILKGKAAVKEEDLMKWANWFETANRTIACDDFAADGVVSTVFLGIDHSFAPSLPTLFETMIFGGAFDGYTARYHTYEQAELGHKHAVSIIKERQDNEAINR